MVRHRLLRAGGLGTFAFVVFGLRPALAGAGSIAAYAPWMLAVSALAPGNSFPQIPCRLADPGCTANYQLQSAGGLTDAVVASTAFAVLAITPFPLWRRFAVNGQFNIPTGGQVKVPTPRGQLRSAASSFDQVRDSNRLFAMGAWGSPAQGPHEVPAVGTVLLPDGPSPATVALVNADGSFQPLGWHRHLGAGC